MYYNGKVKHIYTDVLIFTETAVRSDQLDYLPPRLPRLPTRLALSIIVMKSYMVQPDVSYNKTLSIRMFMA